MVLRHVRQFSELRATAAYHDVRILSSLTKEYVAAYEYFGVTLQWQYVDQSPGHRLHLVPVEQPTNDAATRSCDLIRDANHIVDERAEVHLQQAMFHFATRRLPATGLRKTPPPAVDRSHATHFAHPHLCHVVYGRPDLVRANRALSLFDNVGREQFSTYEQIHQRLTTRVVGPAMLVEVATAMMLLNDANALVWIGFRRASKGKAVPVS